jgi:hypothetical protein
MIYDKEAVGQYKISQREIGFQKVGSSLMVFVAYYFGGMQAAVILGLVSVIYSLGNIEELLHYQNFMKEKEIGVH